MHQLRVLIVDDDPIVCEIIKERIEGMGHVAFIRGSALGVSAMMTGVDKPDLVLLDLRMPGLSGKGLAQLGAMKEAKIVLHSSTPQQELNAIAEELGALGAIQKTSNAALFSSKLRALLGKL